MTKVNHKFPKLEESKCIGCGTCASVCPRSVFEMKETKAKVIKPEECIECNACVQSCPVEIIKLVGD